MTTTYFFIQHYPNWKTGGHKYHSRLYEYALKKGYPVKVFGNSRIEDKYFKNKIIRLYYGLLNTFRIPKKNVILMTNASFLDYIIPIYINKLLKRHKYFFIIHHLVQDEKPASRSRRFLEKAFVKAADHHIAVSEFTKSRLKELNLVNTEVNVVPPGLDKRPFGLGMKSNENFRLLYVGTIERRKGILDLVKVLKNFKHYKLELNIIGLVKEDDYYGQILSVIKEDGIENMVNFLGRVSNEKLEEYYISSNLFVFPSYWEGYGMVIAEAMSYGLPVVISDIPVFKELITHGKEGYFFELNNPASLTSILDNIFKDKVLLKIHSMNAYETVTNFLSYDETSQKIMDEVDSFILDNKKFFSN